MIFQGAGVALPARAREGRVGAEGAGVGLGISSATLVRTSGHREEEDRETQWSSSPDKTYLSSINRWMPLG